jgi:hypothetical protein
MPPERITHIRLDPLCGIAGSRLEVQLAPTLLAEPTRTELGARIAAVASRRGRSLPATFAPYARGSAFVRASTRAGWLLFNRRRKTRGGAGSGSVELSVLCSKYGQ